MNASRIYRLVSQLRRVAAPQFTRLRRSVNLEYSDRVIQTLCGYSMQRLKRKSTVLTVSALLITLAGLVYVYPVTTFGGKYRHHESNSEYEFHCGRFLENGKELGRYSVVLRSVRIKLDIQNEPIHATIGWNTLSMAVPKYGPSVLTKLPSTPHDSMPPAVGSQEDKQLPQEQVHAQ